MLESEIDSLLPAHGDYSRRDVIRSALGSGFAAADDGWWRCLAWFKTHGVA